MQDNKKRDDFEEEAWEAVQKPPWNGPEYPTATQVSCYILQSFHY